MFGLAGKLALPDLRLITPRLEPRRFMLFVPGLPEARSRYFPCPTAQS